MRSLFGNFSKQIAFSVILLGLFLSFKVSAQSTDWMNLDTVKAGKFDNGKMWTFEYPPMEYFSQLTIFNRMKHGLNM